VRRFPWRLRQAGALVALTRLVAAFTDSRAWREENNCGKSPTTVYRRRRFLSGQRVRRNFDAPLS
jgi:hypothetical protein